MTKYLWLGVIISLCTCISVVDKDLWEFSGNKQAESTVPIRTDGYYRLSTDQHNETALANYLNFFQSGYLVAAGPPTFWSRFSEKELGGKELGKWGRFAITKDSILFQYFVDTGPAGSFLPRIQKFTVYEGKGTIVNDSTIFISDVKYKIATEIGNQRPGIYEEYHNPPLEFNFIRCDTIPPPNNWLMEEERKRK